MSLLDTGDVPGRVAFGSPGAILLNIEQSIWIVPLQGVLRDMEHQTSMVRMDCIPVRVVR